MIGLNLELNLNKIIIIVMDNKDLVQEVPMHHNQGKRNKIVDANDEPKKPKHDSDILNF